MDKRSENIHQVAAPCSGAQGEVFSA